MKRYTDEEMVKQIVALNEKRRNRFARGAWPDEIDTPLPPPVTYGANEDDETNNDRN